VLVAACADGLGRAVDALLAEIRQRAASQPIVVVVDRLDDHERDVMVGYLRCIAGNRDTFVVASAELAHSLRVVLRAYSQPARRAQLVEGACEAASPVAATLLRRVLSGDGHRWAVPDLARDMGWSPRTLLRKARECLGVTPEYLISWGGIAAVVSLLECTQLSVERAADVMGYPSMSAFCRQVKAVTGSTASALRRRGGSAAVARCLRARSTAGVGRDPGDNAQRGRDRPCAVTRPPAVNTG
jgi:methylphosphotriester-DNA--protein-cysteine methyltransferase